MSQVRRQLVAGVAATATALAGLGLAAPSSASATSRSERSPASERVGRYETKTPTSRGYGGAVTSVDPEASRIGLRVLRRGGNAVDAAVATAAALGVTEPYSAGIGGGGYFVYYNARTGKVRTLDGRETAPRGMPRDAFVDPGTDQPYSFSDLVSSGVSVGTPGTLATWHSALRLWGKSRLRKALAPATRLARRGFIVDSTFAEQTEDNRERFDQFPATRRLFLRDGQAPKVGSVFRNRDLAATYDRIARRGPAAFYRGRLARQISRTVQNPPKSSNATLPAPAGYLTPRDLARYQVLRQRPTRVSFRGYDVYGMAPSSSGGSTVGEALNILERFPVGSMGDGDALHHYLEASALAFADRGAYLGDPAYVDVPLRGLLADGFAAERACRIDPDHAASKPVPAGDARSHDGRCDEASRTAEPQEDTENISTTNLTVADRWGNVVDYTLTIEQTGGSAMTVPGRGFLLNNELTDFSTEWKAEDPNRLQGGKRPRSSMSPTIVLRNGKPFLALGSPGGSTIITTVLQMLFNRIDRGMDLQQAIAAPRAAQRNTAKVTAEPEFISAYGPLLEGYGHSFQSAGDAFTSKSQIGAATAIEFGPRGQLTAVSEPVRRGGGSALVVRRSR
ncbi:MAG: gamma-glutamyltransferase [Marmoricola sp.]